MTEFVFLFCLLFRWGVLHRVLVGWCQVLYFSGFLCVSSHYLIPTRVSTLVVEGTWSQCSHSKGSGLDLCYVILSKLLNVAKPQLNQQQSTDWKYHLLLSGVLSCQSINKVSFWEEFEFSVVFFFFFSWGTLHSSSWLCWQWLCITWFPWLESPLWGLGKLGFQGWIVVRLSILGECGK